MYICMYIYIYIFIWGGPSRGAAPALAPSAGRTPNPLIYESTIRNAIMCIYVYVYVYINLYIW